MKYTLEQISDRLEIEDLITEYADAIDEVDIDLKLMNDVVLVMSAKPYLPPFSLYNAWIETFVKTDAFDECDIHCFILHQNL